MKKYLYIIVLLLSAASCVYPYDEVLETPEEPVLVVDGKIVIGGYSMLKVGYMKGFDGKYPQGKISPVLEAWWVEDEDGTKYTPPSLEQEVNTIALNPEHRYRMVVKADGITCVSEFEKTPAPPSLSDLHFECEGQKHPVKAIVSIKPSADDIGYVAFEWEEIWEFHAQLEQMLEIYKTVNEDGEEVYVYIDRDSDLADLLIDPAVWPNYWCWKKEVSENPLLVDHTYIDGPVNNYHFYSFLTTDSRNHRNYTLKLRARTLTEEEYRFLSSLKMEGEALNSLLSPNPGEVPGNVYNDSDSSRKVLGYVSVYQPSSITASLHGEFLEPQGRPDDSFFTKVNDWNIPFFYYDQDFRPVLRLFDDAGPYVGWASRRCVECTLNNGTLEMPEFLY